MEQNRLVSSSSRPLDKRQKPYLHRILSHFNVKYSQMTGEKIVYWQFCVLLYFKVRRFYAVLACFLCACFT